MQPIQFFAARAEDGALLPGAFINVFVAGTQSLAALYLDSAAAISLTNPFNADANARVFFFTAADRIDIQVSYGGYRAPLLQDIRTTDPADIISAEIDRLRIEVTDGKIHASEAVGRAAVVDGAYFYAQSTSAKFSRTLWKRLDANSSIHIADDPAAQYVEDLDFFTRTKLITEAADGILLSLCDSNRNRTWLEANDVDGGLTPWTLEHIYRYLGVKSQSIPGYLHVFPDAVGNLTDLCVRDTDGQVPDWVIARWAPRLAPLIGGGGAIARPKTAFNNLTNMPRLRMKQAKIRLGEIGVKARIGIGRDSYSAGHEYYVNPLTQLLIKEFGFGGPGYIGFNHGAALGSTNFQYSRSPTYFGGSWVVSELGAASPDNRSITAGAEGDYVSINAVENGNITTRITSAKLFYLGDGSAPSLRYRWGDALEWNTLMLTGTGPQEIAFPVIAEGLGWHFRMEVESGRPTLFGVYLENSASGVVVSKLAASGSASGDWYKNEPAWLEQQRAADALIPLDAMLIMLGGNDQGASVPPATFLNNLQGHVAQVRLAHPEADIVVIMRWDTTRTSVYPMTAYTELAAEWCWSQGIAFCDMSFAAMGDPEKYASTGVTPLIGADKIHPDPATGGRVITEFFYRFLRAA